MKFRHLILLSVVLVAPMQSVAQEILVTTTGREINIKSYRIREDGSAIDFRTCLTCLNSIPVDSVAELVSLADEKIHHLKLFNSQPAEMDFLELVAAGRVKVYRRILLLGQASTWVDNTSDQIKQKIEVEQYFLEKDGVLKPVLPADGLSWLEKGLLLREFVEDDAESVRAINNVNFRLTPASLLNVVDNYNSKMFEPVNADEAEGVVSCILAGDRYASDVPWVEVNGKTWWLSNESFAFPTPVRFSIPVTVDTKLCVLNDEGRKCKVVRATRHFAVFLEVWIDKVDQEIALFTSDSKRFSRLAKKASSPWLR